MLDFFNKKEEKRNGRVLLFDIGGTKMRAAVSADGRNIGQAESAPTPGNFEEGMKALSALAEKVLDGKSPAIVSGGIAGVMDRSGERLFHSPHLYHWDDKPLLSELEEMFRAPVHLENDAALAGLGEAVFGAGKGKDIVAYFTVSTGLGGARIVGGRIDVKVFGFEPGHQIINLSGLNQEGRGELESLVSGASIEKRYGRKPDQITSPAILSEFAREFAVGLHNSILHWSPEVVVLGGPLIVGERPIPIELVRDELDKLITMFPEVPPVKKAILGESAGLLGALEAIRGMKSDF